MSRNRRRRLLVPEAREAMDGLMRYVMTTQVSEYANEGQSLKRSESQGAERAMGGLYINRDGQLVRREFKENSREQSESENVASVAASMGIRYTPNGDNGDLTTRQAGKIGGQIGGSMVKRLIQIAEQELARENAEEQ